MHDYKPVINLIQDLATPHNNVLIRHFMGDLNAKIKLWYARELRIRNYIRGRRALHMSIFQPKSMEMVSTGDSFDTVYFIQMNVML
ncbi:MAG: hypothetical protein V9H69_14615 [Anaerolineae bacterium]